MKYSANFVEFMRDYDMNFPFMTAIVSYWRDSITATLNETDELSNMIMSAPGVIFETKMQIFITTS